MSIRFLVFVAAWFCLHGEFAAAEPVTQSTAKAPAKMQPGDDARELLRIAEPKIKAEDWATATAVLRDAIVSPGFGLLDRGQQSAVFTAAGQILQEQKDFAGAHADLVRATAFDEAGDVAWRARLAAAFSLKNYADSALCVATVAQKWPQALAQINNDAIFTIADQSMRASVDGPVTSALLSALFDAKWTVNGEEPAFLWRQLSATLLLHGDAQKAADVAARIDAPYVVMQMRIDKRYDAIAWPESPAEQVERTKNAQLERLAVRMKKEPKRLSVLIGRLYALVRAGRCADVLSFADAAIARARGAKGTEVYDDFDEKYVWVLDTRARALRCLGRYDDAIAQMIDARRLQENGAENVSQALNLGDLYASLGRADEAEQAIAHVGSMSAFGRMQLESVKLSIALVRSDATAVQRQLDFLREHRDDAIVTYQEALLDTDRGDAAAALYIERLRDLRWRDAALAEAQHYVGGSSASTPRSQHRERRRSELLARPDVQKEVDALGRVERFNLASSANLD